LLPQSGNDAHEFADRLTKSQFGQRRGRVNADAESWYIDDFADHFDRNNPSSRIALARKLVQRATRIRVFGNNYRRLIAGNLFEKFGNFSGVFLVDCDNQPGGGTMSRRSKLGQLIVRLAQNGAQPAAFLVEPQRAEQLTGFLSR